MNVDKLTVRVDVSNQFGHWAAASEIDDLMAMAFEPLKRCDDALMAMVTGAVFSEAAAQKVVKLREDAADRIAKQLARMIVESMGANDTLNGYPVRIDECVPGQ